MKRTLILANTGFVLKGQFILKKILFFQRQHKHLRFSLVLNMLNIGLNALHLFIRLHISRFQLHFIEPQLIEPDGGA